MKLQEEINGKSGWETRKMFRLSRVAVTFCAHISDEENDEGTSAAASARSCEMRVVLKIPFVPLTSSIDGSEQTINAPSTGTDVKRLYPRRSFFIIGHTRLCMTEFV